VSREDTESRSRVGRERRSKAGNQEELEKSRHFHDYSMSTGCEGYCRPFFKMVSCINRLSDHDKIFTVYPLLHLLLSSGVHLPARLKGPRQESREQSLSK
jgi:hypothetical protein